MTPDSKPKPKHLGRGLESLLGPFNFGAANPQVDIDQGPPAVQDKQVSFPPDKGLAASMAELPIGQIRPNPYQPRTTWSEEQLSELAESIRANGVIQPVLVRPVTGGYELIAGERRLRAAEIAGLATIPALVRKASESEMLELALVENIHRTNLTPIERALAYRQYLDTFNLSQSEAANRLGEDRSVVANHLRLLDLPKEIREMLESGTLSMGHARAILALPTDELRRKLANRAMAGRLSVREVERLVRLTVEGTRKPSQKADEKAAHILDLERRMREVLGTRVSINAKKRGHSGRIIIEYYSLDEFDRVTDRLGISGPDAM
jgi:ParB family chromosome partitioning protein